MSLQEQMTALANEVRRLTGVSDKMSLSMMAEKLKVVNAELSGLVSYYYGTATALAMPQGTTNLI